jgi:hypothetical protein
MQIRRYCPDDLAGILRLCEAEHWSSFPGDPSLANRALTAPGSATPDRGDLTSTGNAIRVRLKAAERRPVCSSSELRGKLVELREADVPPLEETHVFVLLPILRILMAHQCPVACAA